MAITNLAPSDMRARAPSLTEAPLHLNEAHASAVSWGAIFAGAAGAAALSLILLILGTGLGLSSVSPWANQGASATTIGTSTIVWITLTSIAAAGMGGYLAGRLRTKWASAHVDEVYFRDTAHGFLAWAVATIATAAMLSSAIGSIVGGGLQAGASVASGAATAAAGTAAAAAGGTAAKMGGSTGVADMGSGYFLDSLFRKDPNAANAAPAAGNATSTPTSTSSGTTDSSSNSSSGMNGGNSTGGNTAEVGRIFMNSLGTGALPADDLHYVGQLVARNTGLSQQDAEKRVTDTYSKMQAKARDAETAARDAADKTRKASAYTALWLFVSLLIGAFVASWSATFGGRRRDL